MNIQWWMNWILEKIYSQLFVASKLIPWKHAFVKNAEILDQKKKKRKANRVFSKNVWKSVYIVLNNKSFDVDFCVL